jgi:hypothetical protein
MGKSTINGATLNYQRDPEGKYPLVSSKMAEK